MAEPTPEVLLKRALDRGGGRNKAGLWLAQQLHANGYALTDAESIMRDYALSVPQVSGKDPYTEREALSTLKAEYNRQALEPWNAGEKDSSRRDRRVKPAMPTLTPKQTPTVDPEKQAVLKRQLETLRPLTGSPAAAYLEDRGIPVELAKMVGVKHSPAWYFSDVKATAAAVVFPIRNQVGKVIAAQGRAIQPTGGCDKITYGQKTLGCFATSGALESDPVAIVEAPIDALTLARAGLPALATCGTGIAEWLKKALSFKTVFIATDADTEGEEYAKKIPAELIPFGAKCYRLRPPVKDWNELLKAGIDELRSMVDSAYSERGFMLPTLPDPRPDLTADTNAWIRLLKKVEPESDLQSVVYGFRCCGARLTAAGITYDPEGSGWQNQADYQADYDRWIKPYTDELRQLMEV